MPGGSEPVTDADLERIAAEITSADSPVGIDAKKTHVRILANLEDLKRRLDRIERHLDSRDSGRPAGTT